jgi:predicted kinase
VALLVVFAGLPGSGKSVLARGVADAIGATYLRIDTIEAAIATTLMSFHGNPVGYVVAERVAADQLISGRDVVADAVNGVAPARAGWVQVAARTGAGLRFVEVRCSDATEHRRRVEGREPEMPGHGVPTWEQVQRRRYEPWPPELSGRLVIDNVGDPAVHVARIAAGLSGQDRLAQCAHNASGLAFQEKASRAVRPESPPVMRTEVAIWRTISRPCG